MPQPEHGELVGLLLRKAAEDAVAVRELAPNHRVADSIVGFHAQQAVEKVLKAVVVGAGRDLERTHDLARLVELATASGAELPVAVDDVIALTEYAVPFRYDDLLDGESLDRDATVTLVDAIEQWAARGTDADTDPQQR